MRSRLRPAFAALALPLAALGGQALAKPAEPPIAYGCNDLVVDGAIATESYADMSGPDDLLGHGQFTGTLFIDVVLRGKPHGRKVKVFYFSHSEMNQAQFRFVLRPVSGGYELRSAARRGRDFMKLARRCDPALD